ncbi:MAG TPA: hypothetical protein VFO70_10595 [Chitinophagaceae bacterium]|nr:hypothetical protein [Chitinophagaceae bacterium]
MFCFDEDDDNTFSDLSLFQKTIDDTEQVPANYNSHHDTEARGSAFHCKILLE